MPPVLYRIWCQDGPRHDAVPHHRLQALVASGHLDLEDRVAPQGTDDWMPAWKFEGLFEPDVVRALERNAAACAKMTRTISGGWLTLVEYRAERDRLLEREPGVAGSDWTRRPRPDLLRAGAMPVLRKAADEGAAAEREAEQARLRANRTKIDAAPAPARPTPDLPSLPPPAPAPAVRSFRRNVGRLLEGDLAGALEPARALQAWRRHGLRDALIALALALVLDPLQPVVHAQQHWLVALSVACVACLLLQLASSAADARWTDRFASCMLALVLTAAMLVAGFQADMQRGLLAHLSPKVAAWQDQLRAALHRD